MARATFNSQPGLTPPSAATIRTNIQGMLDSLAAVGFVRTTDTGQVDPSTITTVAASQNFGYAMYALEDSLHDTAPIFLLVTFSVNGNSKFIFGLSIGKGTDGAGTLLDPIASPVSNYFNSSTSSANTHTTYVARGDGWFSICLMVGPSASAGPTYPTVLAFERAIDMVGNYRSDAFYLFRYGYNGGVTQQVNAFAYGTLGTLGALHPSLVLSAHFSGGSSGVGGGIIPMFLPPLIFAPGVEPWQPSIVAAIPGSDNPGVAWDTVLYGRTCSYIAPRLTFSSSSSVPMVYAGTIAQDPAQGSLAFRWDA